MTPVEEDLFRPMFVETLGGLARCLGKAVAHFDAREIDHGEVLRARIHPDMFPLERQLRITLRHPLNVCSHFGAGNIPKLAEGLTRLEEFKAHAHDIVTYLEALPPEVFRDGLRQQIVHSFQSGNTETFSGGSYLTRWVLPNFYFHVTTAYGILRGLGVEIGKKDYMGGKLPK